MDQPRAETLHEFLDRREGELADRIHGLRCELAPLEKEISEIRKTRATLGLRSLFFVPPVRSSNPAVQQHDGPPANVTQILERVVHNEESRGEMTIKELVIRALLDFPSGAMPEEIGEHIAKAFGRTVNPGSLRPNLARLREDEIVMHDGLGSKWILAPRVLGTLQLLYSETPLMKAAKEAAWREEDDDPVKRLEAELNKPR